MYHCNSSTNSIYIDVSKIEANTIENLNSEIKVRDKIMKFSLKDDIFNYKSRIKIDRDQWQDCNKSGKVRLGHWKFCGDTFWKECLYFKYKIYKRNRNNNKLVPSMQELNIWRFCHAKFIIKEHCTELIDQVRLKEDEIAVQIDQYQNCEQTENELKSNITTVSDLIKHQKDENEFSKK